MCGIVGAFSFRDSGFLVTERYLTPHARRNGTSWTGSLGQRYFCDEDHDAIIQAPALT
jgi:hypothetical protein